MKKITLLFLLSISAFSFAQVHGKVSDTNGEPLAFVSVYLDKTVTGTTTNDDGNYVLEINKTGNYTIVFQFLGYTTLKKEIIIAKLPFVLNVMLEEEKVELDEILITANEDPANKIIRNAIDHKEKNTDKFSNYTAKFYSRGLTRIKDAPESFLGISMGDFGGGLDSTRSGIVYLSETFSNISFQKKPKKFKEKIVASKVSGQDNGISFNRAEDSNLNLYDNSIATFNNLVSPISTNAFSYYNFKLEGTFYDKNGKLINKIKLLPKRKNDKIFEGSIYIVEDDWALYGVDVSTSGAQVGIPIVNSLHLKQSYNYSDAINGWVLIGQSIDFDISIFGFKPTGKFSYVYSDYDFKPNFTEETFTNEILSFEKNATKKDTVFWNKLRPVPLTKEESKDYFVKDSVKTIRKSKKYLDSVDRKGNKFGWLDPIVGYAYRNSFKNRSFGYSGPLFSTNFNTVQGLNSSVGFRYFEQINEQGKWWNAGVSANYGFSDKRLRPTFFFQKKWNNFSRPRLYISGGVSTEQFNERAPILALNNSISSLMDRLNYLKIFDKAFAKVQYSEEIKNGVFLDASIEYAERSPLFNTTNYSFAPQDKNGGYTSNNPLDVTDFTNAAFNKHTLATFSLGTRIVFGQKYLSYPDSKINQGNPKYPTLNLRYTKRFGASDTELNSDLFLANLRQRIDAGNFGQFIYNIRAGAFLKKKNIAFMDNLQANGNQLTFPLENRLSSFGLLAYYKFYTNDKYAEMHTEYNFKGAVLSKIPLINKLNFHLVGGAKGLFMADKKPYTEYSIGLDNIGFGKYRFIRADYVRSNYGGVTNNGVLVRLSLF